LLAYIYGGWDAGCDEALAPWPSKPAQYGKVKDLEKACPSPIVDHEGKSLSP